MKRILLSLVAIATLSLSSLAQAPEGFNYQAVVRNAGGIILNNQPVGMRLTVQQGSIGGTAVYTETFTSTTNGYGLVNLEIGTGTSTDDFSTIDWANGPYFMETAVDFLGGMTWVVMGTSQLMSVPYALYAKTSGNGEGPAGTDGVDGQDGIDGAIGATGPQGATGLTGATGGYPVHFIGESYGGGIVFYVYDNGQHGLIAATADQSTGIRWYGGSYTNTCARGDGVGAGLKNTAIIIANQGPVDGSTFAARLCNEYSVTVGGITYGDWYLPSKHELNLLYLQKTVVGGFAYTNYWSSTETDNGNAWGQSFFNGSQYNYFKSSNFNVRSVRAF